MKASLSHVGFQARASAKPLNSVTGTRIRGMSTIILDSERLPDGPWCRCCRRRGPLVNLAARTPHTRARAWHLPHKSKRHCRWTSGDRRQWGQRGLGWWWPLCRCCRRRGPLANLAARTPHTRARAWHLPHKSKRHCHWTSGDRRQWGQRGWWWLKMGYVCGNKRLVARVCCCLTLNLVNSKSKLHAFQVDSPRLCAVAYFTTSYFIYPSLSYHVSWMVAFEFGSFEFSNTSTSRKKRKKKTE